MSHLLEAPAGKSGRIRVKDGHFVNDRGRVRLHATNLTGPANFPTHAEAERLAARLARFGSSIGRARWMPCPSRMRPRSRICGTSGCYIVTGHPKNCRRPGRLRTCRLARNGFPKDASTTTGVWTNLLDGDVSWNMSSPFVFYFVGTGMVLLARMRFLQRGYENWTNK